MQTESNCHNSALSWGAILVGALVALGLTFLFNLLTIALGLSLFTQDPDGVKILTFAGYAWVLIGGYIILFISGWIAGRLIYYHCCSLHWCNGVLHGFVTWSVYLIISLFVLSYMASPITTSLLRTAFVGITDETTIVDNTTTNTETTQTVHEKGFATLGSFFIFLVGAFGCCAGAVYGIRECRKCIEKKDFPVKESSSFKNKLE